ncbi:MAG: VWA domain-containing protein [Myxococcota bacterium]
MRTTLIKTFVPALMLLSAAAYAKSMSPTEDEVKLTAEVGTPVMLAGKTQTTYLKVGLTGFDLPAAKERAPVNLAVVIDRSGSMSGDRIIRAKEAAIMLLDRLDERDIVSIVTYDSQVEVLVPATRATDRGAIRAKIERIEPRGSTALFAGVSQGAHELRKFIDKNRVNRVILLSDGQANVGPSSPNELGRLGLSLGKEGVAVTTIGLGLGYNEDLMTQLAQNSDGNHAFVENAGELAKVFDAELGDVLSVVAQEVSVKVHFQNGVKPVKGLNREAEVRGDTAYLALNQLYSRQEKYFLLEVEVPAGAAGTSQELATVEVSYGNMLTKKTSRLATAVAVSYSTNLAEVDARANQPVMVSAIEAIGTLNTKRAVQLRDQGDVAQAKQVLLDNANYLDRNATKYAAPKLKSYSQETELDAKNLEGDNWNKARKAIKKQAYTRDNQQSY